MTKYYFNRIKLQLRECPKHGPYTAGIKFCEVHSMLQERFSSETVTYQEASKVVRHAFQNVTIERTTYIFGLRRVPTALETTYPQLHQLQQHRDFV